MSTAKTIKLKDYKGNMLYSYRCENNSYKITLEKAIEEHAALNGLLLIGADLSEMKFTHWFISDATFVNCDMSRTMWDAVQMYGVVFQKVSFKIAVIKNSEIVDSAFFWCNLTPTTFEKDVLSNNIFSFCVGYHNTKFKEFASPIRESFLKIGSGVFIFVHLPNREQIFTLLNIFHLLYERGQYHLFQ